MQRLVVPLLFLLLPLVCQCASGAVMMSTAASSEHADLHLKSSYDLWDSVVSKYVSSGEREGIELNVIDYEGISKDADFAAYIASLAKVNTTGFNRSEVYAFFMNVYNALAIKMIIDHPCHTSIFGHCSPIKSIKDIGSLLHPVWKMTAGVVAGKNWSLDDVENYLRSPPAFKEDSRLHACIVCASISCPNVRTEAYRPGRLDQQMDSQVSEFLANNMKGLSLDRSSNTLTLSPIFQWFKADFDSYGGVLAFILPHLSSTEDAQYIRTHQHNLTISYFGYDWNANGDPPCKC